MTRTSPESLSSGIAALDDTVDPFTDSPPYQVAGVAMPGDIITHGGSGMAREWPGEVLRRSASLLVGKSIVQDFHPAAAEQAPASTILGQITDAWYDDNAGLLFEGEIIDQEAAQKIARGYLEVSLRPMISAESYDAANDRHVVEEIVDFLDIALVDEGAARGNQINVGTSPTAAALSQHVIANAAHIDSLQRSEARTPSYSGTRANDSWPDGGPSLSSYISGYYEHGTDSDPDDRPSQWGDLPQEARNWISARTLLGDPNASDASGGISYPVVHPNDELSQSGLQSARRMAGHAPSESAADSIRSMTATLLENEFDQDVDTESNAADSPSLSPSPPTSTSASTSTSTSASPPLIMTRPDALQDDEDDADEETRLETWAAFLADVSGEVNTDAVDFAPLHRLLAAEIPDASVSAVADGFRPEWFDMGFSVDDARETLVSLVTEGVADHDHDQGDETDDADNEDTTVDDSDSNDTGSGSDSDEYDSMQRVQDPVTAALRGELELTGTTPDRCRTIKSGAMRIDTHNNALARDVLNIPDESEMIDVESDSLARTALGLDDDDDEEEVETIDIAEDEISRSLLGLDEEEETDPVVKSFGERIRARAAEPDDGPEMVDIEEDEISRSALGLGPEEEEEPDPIVKSFGERLRNGYGTEEEDGPETIDIEEDDISRSALGLEDDEEDDEPDEIVKSFGERVRNGYGVEEEDGPEMINLEEDDISRSALGLEDDEEEEELDPVVKSFGERVREGWGADKVGDAEDDDKDAPERINIEEDELSRHLLGLDVEEEEPEPDPTVKSFGERVRRSMREERAPEEPERTNLDEDALAGQAVGVRDDVRASVSITTDDDDTSTDE